MPDPWVDKTNLTLLAGVVGSEEEVLEVWQFCKDNPLPGHRVHHDLPPHPSRKEFLFYFERGNPIVVARDQDGLLWGMQVLSRAEDKRTLWFHVRREPLETHDDGTTSPNSLQTMSHLTSMKWVLAGGPTPMQVPIVEGSPVNPNVERMDHYAIRRNNLEVYNFLYGPANGLPEYTGD